MDISEKQLDESVTSFEDMMTRDSLSLSGGLGLLVRLCGCSIHG